MLDDTVSSTTAPPILVTHKKGIERVMIKFHTADRRVVEEYPDNSIVQLAAVLDMAEGLRMFRSFGVPTARLLVLKSIEIHKLWKEIEAYDAIDGVENAPTGYRLDGLLRGDPNSREVQTKLDLLLQLLTNYCEGLSNIEKNSILTL